MGSDMYLDSTHLAATESRNESLRFMLEELDMLRLNRPFPPPPSTSYKATQQFNCYFDPIILITTVRTFTGNNE
jgi:hypothetical protein